MGLRRQSEQEDEVLLGSSMTLPASGGVEMMPRVKLSLHSYRRPLRNARLRRRPTIKLPTPSNHLSAHSLSISGDTT